MKLIDEIEKFDNTQALQEGWCISFACGGSVDDNYQIQKLDEVDIFENDSDAHKMIVNKSKTSQYHKDVLDLIKTYNAKEYDLIMKQGD